MPSLICSASPSVATDSLRQGEIISDLIQIRLDILTLQGAEPLIQSVRHPYAMILTQDCDLEQDRKARDGKIAEDKLLPGILFCEVITAAQLRGTPGLVSNMWTRIRQNQDERYHFLQKTEPSDDAANSGLPELGIDFKRYFTIPTDEIYERLRIDLAKRRCVLKSPYLEHMSHRFASFLSRVALPEPHLSEPVE